MDETRLREALGRIERTHLDWSIEGWFEYSCTGCSGLDAYAPVGIRQDPDCAWAVIDELLADGAETTVP